MSERKKEVRYIASKFANAILADYSSYIISPDGLQALNAFLDELLFILIDAAKSTDMHRIKSAIYQTFPQSLGKNAIVEAELEAKSYLEMGGKDIPKDDPMTRHTLYDLDSEVEQVFEQFRAKCQYYSKLGERLGSPAGNPAIAIIVPTLLAIYVTAVLEHIAEHVLLISSSIADRQDHADMVTAKEVYMGLLEDRQTENVFEIMILKTQLQKRFFRQSLLMMSPSEPAQVKRSGSWGKQLRLGNADKPKIDVQLPMDFEDDPIDPNRPQFGDWDDANDEESKRKKKSEFEQLISSGETMKVSLTPNRLRTIEVHRKAGGVMGVASRSSSRAASVFGGKHGRRPSHGERPAANGRKNGQSEPTTQPTPSVPEPAVPAMPPVPSLGGAQTTAKKQVNGHAAATSSTTFPTPPASMRGLPPQQQQQQSQSSQPLHGLGISKDGRTPSQDGLFNTPFPMPPSHATQGSSQNHGATPPASPNGPDRQVPPPLNLATPQFGRTSSNNSVASSGSQHGSTGGGRASIALEVPMTPVSESGSFKKENPIKSFMGRLGRNSMSRDSMDQQSINGTSSPTSIRSFIIGASGFTSQTTTASGAAAATGSSQHGSHSGGSTSGSIQSSISHSSTLRQQQQLPTSSTSAYKHDTTNTSLHQGPTSPVLGGPVAIPSRNASLNQEVTSPSATTFPSFNAAAVATTTATASPSPTPAHEIPRAGSPRNFPLPPSYSHTTTTATTTTTTTTTSSSHSSSSPSPSPLASQHHAQYPNKPVVPERTTSSPTIQSPSPKSATSTTAHVPWKPYTPVPRSGSFGGASASTSSLALSSSGGQGGAAATADAGGAAIPASGTVRANPFVQADVLKRESTTPSPKPHLHGSQHSSPSSPPPLTDKSPVREAMRASMALAASAAAAANATVKELVTPPTPDTPSMVSAAAMASKAEAKEETDRKKKEEGEEAAKQLEAGNSEPSVVVEEEEQDKQERSEKEKKAAAIAAAAVAAAVAESKSGRSSVEPSLSSLQMPTVSKRQSIFVDEEAQAMDRLSTQRHRQSMHLDPDAEYDDEEEEEEEGEEEEEEDLAFLTEDDLISGYGQMSTTAPPPEKWHYTSDEDEEEEDEFEDAQGEIRRRRHESFMSAKSTILPSGSTTSLPLRTDDEDDEDEDEDEEESEDKKAKVPSSVQDSNAEADAEVEATFNKDQVNKSEAARYDAAEKEEEGDDDDDDEEPLDFAAPDQGDMLPSQMKAAMLAAASAHAATSLIATAISSIDAKSVSVDSSTGASLEEGGERAIVASTSSSESNVVVTLTLAEQAAKLREERKAARDSRRLAKQEERRRRRLGDQGGDKDRPPTPSTPIPTTQMIPLTPTDLVLIRQKVFSSGNFEASMRMLDTIFHAAMAKMVEGRERGVQTDPVLFADEVDSTTDEEEYDDYDVEEEEEEADLADKKKIAAVAAVAAVDQEHSQYRLQAQKAVKKKKSMEVRNKPSAWVAKAVEQVQQQQQQPELAVAATAAPTTNDDDDDEDRVVEWLLGGV
ncbi:hypothetical protein DFQ27_003977 [Actinomortierella ambigua]|uniref:Uncharacterized protein n=1 Tax=Actinomortierella ambigua TaxID=1343610 RepID=A0A9P6U548_9FUNG|nr:hypothetical protein DFQ27_003977 [Actinomortierella ambigua]